MASQCRSSWVEEAWRGRGSLVRSGRRRRRPRGIEGDVLQNGIEAVNNDELRGDGNELESKARESGIGNRCHEEWPGDVLLIPARPFFSFICGRQIGGRSCPNQRPCPPPISCPCHSQITPAGCRLGLSTVHFEPGKKSRSKGRDIRMFRDFFRSEWKMQEKQNKNNTVAAGKSRVQLVIIGELGIGFAPCIMCVNIHSSAKDGPLQPGVWTRIIRRGGCHAIGSACFESPFNSQNNNTIRLRITYICRNNTLYIL